MDLKVLRTFLAVADTGSISAAAGRLHSVQSNITARIKALESEMGVELFLRSRTGMRLSAAGEVLQPHAREVIAAAERARRAVEEFSDQPAILRLGSMETTLAVRLTPALARFRAAHPGLRIRAETGTTEELAARLLAGGIDLAFIAGPFPHPDLTATPVFHEEMVLVTHPDLSDITSAANQTVIAFRAGCSYRAFALDWLRRAGLAPNDIFELGTLDGILGCVAAGIGIALLPRSAAEASPHRASLRLHTLEDDARHIDTLAVANRSAPANAAVAGFLDCLAAGPTRSSHHS